MPHKRYFHRTKHLEGKDLEDYERLRARISGLGKRLAERIEKLKGDNPLFVVLDRDARPIYLALKKLGVDAKLVPINRNMVPKKLQEDVNNGRDPIDSIRENMYYEGEGETKIIDKILREHGVINKDKDRKIVVLDSGYAGTIPEFVKTRLLLNGHKDVETLVWYKLAPKEKKEILRELEDELDTAFGRTKLVGSDVGYMPSKKNKERKSADLFILALAEEILEHLKSK